MSGSVDLLLQANKPGFNSKEYPDQQYIHPKYRTNNRHERRVGLASSYLDLTLFYLLIILRLPIEASVHPMFFNDNNTLLELSFSLHSEQGSAYKCRF